MGIFHEFLSQFEEGVAYAKRKKPSFGWRITSPPDTFCAWLDWHNYRPKPGTAATVRDALANLQRGAGERPQGRRIGRAAVAPVAQSSLAVRR